MTGSALKLLMMLLMVLDHIEYFIPEKLYIVLHIITRCVAPFFAYMAVEGFIHTRSRPKYIMRLLIAAGIMYAGNALVNHFILQGTPYEVHDNIFATLGACVLSLWCFTSIAKGRRALPNIGFALAGTIVALCGTLMLDWGYVLIPLAIITYYCRDKQWLRNTLYLALSVAAFLLVDYQPYPTLQETLTHLARQCQFLFIIFLPFIYLYNGKRGSSSALTKYGFYIFYPLHIWIIRIVAWAIH